MKLYHRCQVCETRAAGEGTMCGRCDEYRTEALALLSRFPRINFLSTIGIERVSGVRLSMPISQQLRNMWPRELVAAVCVS